MHAPDAILSAMDIAQAIQMAKSILDEERVLPTVDYIDPFAEWIEDVRKKGTETELISAEVARAMKGREKYGDEPQLNLDTERGMRPRPVHESPHDYVFRSVNFKLLLTLYNQLQEVEKDQFISAVLNRVPNEAASTRQKVPRFPCYQHQMSELPLVAEFCVRTGRAKELFAAIGSVNKPTIGLVLLLWQLEEIIALNFNLLSDQELVTVPASLRPVVNMCEKLAAGITGKRLQNSRSYSQTLQEIDAQAKAIIESIKGIREECRKAQYFYLKGALLQQTPNLEIESDKAKVESILTKLGFSEVMVGALNAAESDYKSTSSPFELKNCLGHLRSFLEHLHREAAKSIAAVAKETITDAWGPAILYLRQKTYMTKQHETFVASLYTLISDESVHAMGTEQEYARLLRNVVIEYGVMFLTVLDKNNFKIQV